MSPPQQALDILSQETTRLSSYRKQANEISKNKDVVAWQKVNIDSFSDIIEDLGLPNDLRQSRDTYQNIARSVLKSITTLQNNIDNLKSDIKLTALPENKAMPQAKKIQAEIAEILPTIEKLQHCQKSLESSTLTLKKNLNITTLLPLARKTAEGKKKSIFETGFKIYLIAANAPGFEEENQLNMYAHFEKANFLKKKLSTLAINKTSAIAQSMLDQQIKLCNDGLQEVKDFILFVEKYVQKDLHNLTKFHDHLAEMSESPLTDILFNVPKETENLAACIRDFVHKKFLLEELDRAAQLILMIEQLYAILNDHFIDYLMEQDSSQNGLLNPETIATARASKYFSGVMGFYRTIRLLIGGFSQQEVLSAEILQEKLHSLLTNCTNFFSHEEEDQQNTSTYIESYFGTYNAPFPKAELIDIANKCLVTYGTILEKVMFRYKIDKEDPNNYSIGRLSGKIEVRKANLEKYRQKLTPS